MFSGGLRYAEKSAQPPDADTATNANAPAHTDRTIHERKRRRPLSRGGYVGAEWDSRCIRYGDIMQACCSRSGGSTVRSLASSLRSPLGSLSKMRSHVHRP